MMDSDEDDIYPDQDDVYGSRHQSEVKMEDADDGEEEGEEVEEDDDVYTLSRYGSDILLTCFRMTWTS